MLCQALMAVLLVTNKRMTTNLRNTHHGISIDILKPGISYLNTLNPILYKFKAKPGGISAWAV